MVDKLIFNGQFINLTRDTELAWALDFLSTM